MTYFVTEAKNALKFDIAMQVLTRERSFYRIIRVQNSITFNCKIINPVLHVDNRLKN